MGNQDSKQNSFSEESLEILSNSTDIKNEQKIEAAFTAETIVVNQMLGEKKNNNDESLIIEKLDNLKSQIAEPKLENLIPLEKIFEVIEEGFTQAKDPSEDYTFPHPRNWVGPRYLAIWTIPIFAIKRLSHLISASNPIRPYRKSNYLVTKSETIYTATQKALSHSGSMRFFGARFLTIWVLPLAATGVVIEFLLISPMTGIKPFG